MNPALLYFIFGMGTGIFAGHWKPLAFLAPKPPTAQLTALQADLQKAQADAVAKETALKAANAAELARFTEQLRAAQQMSQGAANALGRVPVVVRTPEFVLGDSLLARANVRLATAIGKLPDDLQTEILAIVDNALSASEDARKRAEAALAAKDAEFKIVTADREQIKAQIPVLAAKVQAAEQKVESTQAKVTEKTNEVKVIADKLDAKAREAGSLLGSLDSVWHWAIGIACVWFLLAFVVPGIVKHMASSPLKNGLRAVSGYATSPLLFHDASTKISDLTQPKT